MKSSATRPKLPAPPQVMARAFTCTVFNTFSFQAACSYTSSSLLVLWLRSLQMFLLLCPPQLYMVRWFATYAQVMTSGSGPGKTAPKLAQDFLSFDPRNGRPNILVDSPPPSGEGVQIAAPLGSCKHEYTTKNEQSVPPPIDLRPDGSTRHRLALICKRCRTHADIVVDASRAVNACPSSDHPLHHFQPVPSSRVEEPGRLAYAWCCSIAECSTTVTVVYRAPRLDDDQLDHLSNPQNLKRRYQAAVQEDPGRDGINEATPMIAYNRLATYISNACKPDRSRTSIPDNNKRFIEIFGVRGEECHDLLERLGFKYEYAVRRKTEMNSLDRTDIFHRSPLGAFQIQNKVLTDSRPMDQLCASSLRTRMRSC